MSHSKNEFWIVTAPSRNFEGIPTISVCGNEVPLPAYWQIVDLVTEGKAEEEVVQCFIPHTGARTQQVVTKVVHVIAENQKLMEDRSKSSSRLSVAFKKAKRISAYRATKIEARRELDAAEAVLTTAQQHERKLLNDALLLEQRKDTLKDLKIGSDDRRKTVSAMDKEMKRILQKHEEVERQIKHAKRLTVIHKASLV